MNINSCPAEILIETFSYLNEPDIRNCMQVCKSWKKQLEDSKAEIIWKKLSLSKFEGTDPINGSWKSRWEVFQNWKMGRFKLEEYTEDGGYGHSYVAVLKDRTFIITTPSKGTDPTGSKSKYISYNPVTQKKESLTFNSIKDLFYSTFTEQSTWVGVTYKGLFYEYNFSSKTISNPIQLDFSTIQGSINLSNTRGATYVRCSYTFPYLVRNEGFAGPHDVQVWDVRTGELKHTHQWDLAPDSMKMTKHHIIDHKGITYNLSTGDSKNDIFSVHFWFAVSSDLIVINDYQQRERLIIFEDQNNEIKEIADLTLKKGGYIEHAKILSNWVFIFQKEQFQVWNRISQSIISTISLNNRDNKFLGSYVANSELVYLRFFGYEKLEKESVSLYLYTHKIYDFKSQNEVSIKQSNFPSLEEAPKQTSIFYRIKQCVWFLFQWIGQQFARASLAAQNLADRIRLIR